MSIKTVLFFFLTFCCMVTLIAGKLYIITVLWKIFKNQEKIKTWRTIYPKNQENFKKANLRSNFTGSYKRECTSTGRRKPLQYNQGSTLSFWWRYLFLQSESPFVYQVINKTELSITIFRKQSPWNILIKESGSLNNAFCTYNTRCIYFLFYLIIYLFIYLLFFL